VVIDGALGVRVPYKVYPLLKPEPGFPQLKETWIPTLTVSLVIGHANSRRFEAVVDSGSASCLFHADIGIAHGLDIESGEEAAMGGVVDGARGKVYYHKVKLVVPGSMISIVAGFSKQLSVTAILGRHGFFDHYVVTFDPQNQPPGLT